MYRGEQPRHLAQSLELERSVLECLLPLPEYSVQLHHDREAQRDRDGLAGHLLCDLGIGVDHHFGLTTREPAYLLGARHPLGGGTYDRSNPVGGVEGEPDVVVVESANQRLATALEQLTVGTGMATRGSKGAGQRGEGRQRGGGIHL